MMVYGLWSIYLLSSMRMVFAIRYILFHTWTSSIITAIILLSSSSHNFQQSWVLDSSDIYIIVTVQRRAKNKYILNPFLIIISPFSLSLQESSCVQRRQIRFFHLPRWRQLHSLYLTFFTERYCIWCRHHNNVNSTSHPTLLFAVWSRGVFQ